MGQQGDLGFNSDVDGDLWMHSDSENSAAWTVVVVGSGAGDHSQRETATRTENICFPGLSWRVRSAPGTSDGTTATLR